MTTATKVERATKRRQRNARSVKHFAFGATSGYRLEDVGIPTHCLQTAAATCRFTFQGPRSVGTDKAGKNWGEWIRTRIQSPAPSLHGLTWQTTNDQWSSGDGHDNADLILGCFDLSTADVFDQWGQPTQGEKYELDLLTIVETLRPAMIAADAMMDDPDPRTHARGRQLANAL
jgi:hypothetical protein